MENYKNILTTIKDCNKMKENIYYFLLGILVTVCLWLTAKVFAWLIPGFRNICNRIFVINIFFTWYTTG